MADPITEAMEKAQAHLDAQAEADTTTESAEPVETTAAETIDPAPVEPKTDKPRDEAGKFTRAPKPKAAPKVTKEPAAAAPKGDVHGAAQVAPPAGQGTADGAAPPPSPAAPSAGPASDLKAPSSWKPAAREAFAKAPREVQEEAIRIDREVRQVMQRSAEATKTAEAVHRTLAPFEGLARANGMDSMSYAGSVLQTAAALHMGAPGQKAAIVAQLIATYGIDTDAVNRALQGQPVADQRQAVDPRLEVRRILEEERNQAFQSDQARQAQEFEANPPEFYPVVKPIMLRLLRMDRAEGGNMTATQAYEQACELSKEVQTTLSKRQEAERVRTATAATQAAQAATQVSLRSTPAAPVRAKPKGLDAALSAAREKLGM